MGTNRMRTAKAVCRHLNYRNPLFVRALNRSAEEIRKNFSHIVDCTWNETLSCAYDRAICEVEIFLSCQSALTRSLGVRLVGGELARKGLLEVSTDGSWRKVCGLSKYILSELPTAACRHLGFDGGSMTFVRASDRPGYFQTFYGNCKLNPIEKCIFRKCYNRCFEYVSVVCYRSEWQVRLVNTVHNGQETEGAVQVFSTKLWWKFVCEDKWNMNAAQVVCSELGYEKAISAKRNSELTSSNREWSPFKVLCRGNEKALRRCTHFESTARRRCKVAGLVCKEKECKESDFLPFFSEIAVYLFIDCPSGWFLFADYCYTVSLPRSLNGEVMENGGCGSVNSVSISSPHEQAFVLSLLADITDDVWIGLMRGRDEVFKWRNQEPLRFLRLDLNDIFLSYVASLGTSCGLLENRKSFIGAL